tara:strand:- start:23 stop:712 length:690 start_codon:yes stop_codon:yes gene_type:complete
MSPGFLTKGFRYERKFVASDATLPEILLKIRTHPIIFREIYQARRVNNIYLDTPDLRCYHDNILGRAGRFKSRIRWYGGSTSYPRTTKLEIKIKEGFLGRKESTKLDFRDPHRFALDEIEEALQRSRKKKVIAEHYTNGLKPNVGNSYLRRYFRSADSRFRLTIDWDIRYTQLTKASPWFSQSMCDNNIIIELKYDASHDGEADTVTKYLPYRLVRNSKYINAIDLLYP